MTLCLPMTCSDPYVNTAHSSIGLGTRRLETRPGASLETSRHFPGGLEMSRDPNCLETFTLVG